MYVSRESAEQTQQRLLRVVAAASLRVHDGAFAYAEYPIDRFPAERARDALALVRDDEVWSVLGPASGGESEPLSVFSFHFPQGMDNSGFVGWLASHLKDTLGTGVVVVCGSNAAQGGIFDYWAVPHALSLAALTEIRRLREVTRDGRSNQP